MFEKYKHVFLLLVVAIVAGSIGYFFQPKRQNPVTVFTPSIQKENFQNIKKPVEIPSSTPNKPSSTSVENSTLSVEELLDINRAPTFVQTDNNIMFFERGKSAGVSYGDFYYLSSGNKVIELARSKSIENGLATIHLNQVFFTKAQLSPNGRFVLLQADCWEERCAVIYDLQTNKRHFVPAKRSMNWLESGLLEVIGECEAPSFGCGRYQSKSADMPWELLPKRQQITRGNIQVTKELLPDACEYAFFNRSSDSESPEKRVTYRSQEYGIELQLPYNPLWGVDTYILNPYDQKDKKILYGDILVTGEGCASWVDATRWMEVLPKESKEDILSRLEALDVPSPEKFHAGLEITESIIGGREVISYSWQALCGGGQTIVLGQKYNYGFSSVCSGDEDKEIIRSIQFIP